MTSEAARRQNRLATVLTAGLRATFFVGVVLALAAAITGDGGWPSQQPWFGVRLVVGVLFLVCAVGRAALWVVGHAARRRSRRRA